MATERIYSDQQVREILEHAAKAEQRRQLATSQGLTRAELESAGTGAGIRPEQI